MLGVIRTWSSSEMKLWKIGTMTCCSEQQINRTCRCFGCFNKKPVDEVHDSCPFSWKWANFTSCFWFQFHWLSCFMCFFVDYPTSTQPKYCIISTTLEFVLTTHAMKFFNKKIPCNSWSTLPYDFHNFLMAVHSRSVALQTELAIDIQLIAGGTSGQNTICEQKVLPIFWVIAFLIQTQTDQNKREIKQKTCSTQKNFRNWLHSWYKLLKNRGAMHPWHPPSALLRAPAAEIQLIHVLSLWKSKIHIDLHGK